MSSAKAALESDTRVSYLAVQEYLLGLCVKNSLRDFSEYIMRRTSHVVFSQEFSLLESSRS
jgi:hypothetical protein